MLDLLIVGAGGHAKVVIEAVAQPAWVISSVFWTRTSLAQNLGAPGYRQR